MKDVEIVESVGGVTDDRVRELVDEAERGYNLRGRRWETNPHFGRPARFVGAFQDAPGIDGEDPRRG
ncbi:MAG TPA: hypothetical protein GX743_00545 [Actinomycetales bacterium]|nr:hypothetical protein [Actinomycetales bacterium]